MGKSCRMAIALAVFAIEVAAARAPVRRGPPPPPPTPFEKLVAQARTDFRAQQKDSFAAKSFDSSMEGTAFTITVPFTGTSDALADYSDGSLLLLVPLEREYLRGHLGDTLFSKPGFMAFRVSSHDRHGASYVGQNGYGARTVVSVASGTEAGLAIVSRPEGEFSPLTETPDILRTSTDAKMLEEEKSNYSVRIPLDGPTAKRLRDDAQIVIEGSFAKLADGTLASCNTLYGAATVDSPTEVMVDRCYVGAKVTRIAFTRRSTGEVIKEWVAR